MMPLNQKILGVQIESGPEQLCPQIVANWARGDPKLVSTRHPADYLQEHLPRPLGAGFVLQVALFMRSLRGSQHRQKGQGPHPLNPRNGGQEHQRNPAQAISFHKKLLAGPNRITIDTPCGNLAVSSVLDGCVNAQDQMTRHVYNPVGRVSISSFSLVRILREASSAFRWLSTDWINPVAPGGVPPTLKMDHAPWPLFKHQRVIFRRSLLEVAMSFQSRFFSTS